MTQENKALSAIEQSREDVFSTVYGAMQTLKYVHMDVPLESLSIEERNAIKRAVKTLEKHF